jgi:hypothetical protein
MGRLRIIVGGYLGLFPAGGVTWDYVQYPAGFAALGHDTYYVEDTRLWPVYQTGNNGGADCSANIHRLAGIMDAFGLADRWAYRDEVSGKCFGLSEQAVLDLCRSADVFVNISCSTVLRDEYRDIPARVLIDSDPMFTQIQYATEVAFTPGKPGMRELVDGHSHHFTFGENVGAADCRMPTFGVSWRPTRQPVCLGEWSPTPPPRTQDAAYTTLMNWTAAPPLLFEAETWGQKDVECRRFFSLPCDVPGIPLGMVVGQRSCDPFPAHFARRLGWRILDPAEYAPDWRTYRAFIEQSRGEFSVAKETYVKARTGWFSCRSACYLAAGRPVITQDTGWSRNLPTGRGLIAFRDPGEAADALRRVEGDPVGHGRAARQLAEEFFDSRRVLSDLLRQVGD